MLNSAANEPLRRQLSAFGLWLLITNGMIGAGIFGVPAEVARRAGAFSPSIFVICAALIFPIMLCFASLASYFRASGGPVAYATAGFGRAAGFQAGWALYVGKATAFAANANLLVSTIVHWWPSGPTNVLRFVLLFAICGCLTALTVISTRGSMRWLGGLTLLKFVPLLALILAGLPRVSASTLLVPPLPLPDTGAAVLLAIYAFVGFEAAPVAAGEARDPQRDLPRALLIALATCGLLYALIQLVVVSTLPEAGTSPRPLLDAAVSVIGPAGAWLLTAGVITSVGANLTSSMFTVPRVTYRLALDGSLPRWFGAVHDQYATPAASIVFFGCASFLLAASGSFAALVGMSVAVRLLLFILCIASMPGVRHKLADVTGGLRLPGGNLIPLLAIGECLALLSQVSARNYAYTAGFLLAGSCLYLIATRSNDR